MKKSKRFTVILLLLVLCFAMATPSFAAPATLDTSEEVSVSVSRRGITGYRQVLGVSNKSSSFPVVVTGTSGGGFGITLKTFGSATVIFSIKKPDGTYFNFVGSGLGTSVTLNNTDEKAWNGSNVQVGTYTVSYTVVGGPTDIICHIYG